MRKIAFAMFAATCLFAGSASAGFTLDLIWETGSSKTLTLTGPTTNPGGSTCHPFAGAKAGYCLTVRLTATESFKYATTTIGWNAATSGIAASFLPAIGTKVFGAGGATPVTPTSGVAQCVAAGLAGCDTTAGAWGGATTGTVAAGTYLLGSITFDLSGATVGTHTIQQFFRAGIDEIQNGNGTVIPPSAINSATLIINAIPEPGTASLLGLGIVGLVLAGRRRNR